MTWLTLWLWLLPAVHAQDEGVPLEDLAPLEPGEADAVDDEADIEITVYGELAILQARDAIVDRMEALGYEAVERRDGAIGFRPPHSWMGRAFLDEDGNLTFGRPVIGFSSGTYIPSVTDQLEQYDALQRDSGTGGGGIRLWVLPSESKLDTIRGRVREAVGPALEHYRRVVQRTVLENQLTDVPDRLDRLWRAGVPIDPRDPILETPQARRRAVLDYWATRTDTYEGRRVSEAIERWLRAVVQESEHPVTADEKAAAEARRVDNRILVLD